MQVANNSKREINALKKTEMLTMWVSSIKRKYELERRAKYVYRDRRVSLEAGRLTEITMPRYQLTAILTNARTAGYVAATLEWYYEHCEVRPLWHSAQGMGYIIKLPLTSNEVVSYRFQTYPYLQSSGDWFRLVAHANVGYDQ